MPKGNNIRYILEKDGLYLSYRDLKGKEHLTNDPTEAAVYNCLGMDDSNGFRVRRIRITKVELLPYIKNKKLQDAHPWSKFGG